MEAFISLFSTHFIRLAGSAFVCLFAVRKKLRISGLRAALYTGLFSTVFCALLGIFYQGGFEDSFFGASAFICGGIFLVRVTDAKPSKLVFLLLAVGSFAYFCLSIWNLLYYVFPSIATDEAIYREIAVCGAVYAVFLPPFTLGVSKLWRQTRDLTDAPWIRLCGVSVIFILLYFFSIGLQFEERISPMTSRLIDIFVIICAFITYWQMIVMLLKSTEAARLAENVRLMDGQLALQSGRVEEIAAHVDEMRRLRHDMRHHMGALEGMLARKEYDRAVKYLGEYAVTLDEVDEAPLCGNFIVDIIARRYRAQAERQGIRAEFLLTLPEITGVADTDLCIVLGNLIENALEACAAQRAGEKYLRVQSEIQENRVLVDVRNSFDPDASNARREGMGIPSVRAIAQKYGGIAMFRENGRTFEASALLYRQ